MREGSCADTRVGNQFIPGLSGGQKRRLSLAVLLVRRPALIFLDEPTSGLDAAAAFQIMNFVRELANDLKIIVIATIHQPAASVFNDFSGALVLSNGRVAYQVWHLELPLLRLLLLNLRARGEGCLHLYSRTRWAHPPIRESGRNKKASQSPHAQFLSIQTESLRRPHTDAEDGF